MMKYTVFVDCVAKASFNDANLAMEFAYQERVKDHIAEITIVMDGEKTLRMEMGEW